MRVLPDGLALLRTAQFVIDTAIAPQIATDARAALREIERAIVLGEQLFARDVEASVADLSVLEAARVTTRGRVLEALPEERQYDARLVAKAIAVAARQLANGHLPERREYERLSALLNTPAGECVSASEIRCALPALNERLGARIRVGEADVGTTSYAATLAHLEAITNDALSESNPTYRRSAPGPVPPGSGATHYAAFQSPPASVATALAAWRDVPRAIGRVFADAVPTVPLARRVDSWLHAYGAFGGAICASSSAAFATQANVFGWFAQRLAANPRVPMVAVETAHQAHDVSVALADASAALFELALSPLGVAAPRSDLARLP